MPRVAGTLIVTGAVLGILGAGSDIIVPEWAVTRHEMKHGRKKSGRKT